MIYLATDHAGFEMKETIKQFLEEKGHEVKDLGAFSYDEGDDYPDHVSKVGNAVSEDSESFGFVFGKSGQGEAMVCNRHKGVRAGVYYGGEIEIIKLLREHNNANILSIGAGFVNEEEAKQVVSLFLETPFSVDERHVRRISKF